MSKTSGRWVYDYIDDEDRCWGWVVYIPDEPVVWGMNHLTVPDARTALAVADALNQEDT